MTKILLSMPEIHCPSCEKLVKASISDLQWIQSVSVSLPKKEVEIQYNPIEISPEKIISSIREWTWYIVEEKWKKKDKSETLDSDLDGIKSQVSNLKSSQMVSIDVEGMHCSSCALLI